MEKMKWGIIGCGGIADRRTIPGLVLSDIAQCYAVMDLIIVQAEICILRKLTVLSLSQMPI